MPPPNENPKSAEEGSGEIEDPTSTGLPLLRTWPSLYIFVLAAFILTVILLTWFTRAFS